MQLRILDLDGSVINQPALDAVAPWSLVETLSLSDLAPSLRLWARARHIEQMRKRLPPLIAPTIHLLGSGDFHHLAPLLFEGVTEPFTLLHFDNHPDWVKLAARWHCGGWINRALEHPNLVRVITLGPCSADLERPQMKGANLAALEEGRLILFPWRHAPSRVWGAVREGIAHRVRDGQIEWSCLADQDLQQVTSSINEKITTSAVWLSIDKDVLQVKDATTNWDQGQMPLTALLELIRQLTAGHRILGTDICGDYSIPHHRNPLKWLEARFDQPHTTLQSDAQIRNAQTNRILLRAIYEAAV